MQAEETTGSKGGRSTPQPLSVYAFRILPWVSALTLLNDRLQSARQIFSFPKLLLVMKFYRSNRNPTKDRKL